MHCADATASSFTEHVQCHPGDGRLFSRTDLGGDEIKNQRVLDDLD
jgi:hypothetical protein